MVHIHLIAAKIFRCDSLLAIKSLKNMLLSSEIVVELHRKSQLVVNAEKLTAFSLLYDARICPNNVRTLKLDWYINIMAIINVIY